MGCQEFAFAVAEDGENALTTMAERTGGRVFLPSLGAQLDAAFGEIITNLRTQYLLGFYPRNVPLSKNRFHTLTVKTRRPGVDTRSILRMAGSPL